MIENSNTEAGWKERFRNWSTSPGFRALHEIQSISSLMPYAIGIMLMLSAIQWYSGKPSVAFLLVLLSIMIWLALGLIRINNKTLAILSAQ